MNDSWLFNLVLILTAIGFYCVGRLWEIKRTSHWRINWIIMEHKLARLENREPRDISEIDHKK